MCCLVLRGLLVSRFACFWRARMAGPTIAAVAQQPGLTAMLNCIHPDQLAVTIKTARTKEE